MFFRKLKALNMKPLGILQFGGSVGEHAYALQALICKYQNDLPRDMVGEYLDECLRLTDGLKVEIGKMNKKAK